MDSTDLKRTKKRLLASQAQPMSLRVACALVYHQLTGKTREMGTAADYVVAMNTTALALSQIADIYHVNPAGRLSRIPAEELALGAFEGSGDVYRTRSGNEYSPLSMRRIDVLDAITTLKKARAAIDGARQTAKKIDL
jgi:hypothetical protein